MKGDDDAAIKYLQKAIGYQPDDYLLWKDSGKAYYQLSAEKSYREAFRLAEKSKNSYQMAVHLNPMDAESFFGLSISEARLERLYPFIHDKDKNPYNATPYFKKAIELRPNSVTYNFTYVKYLYNKGRKNEFLDAISNLAKIYPRIYGPITAEPFWSFQVKQAIKKGLFKAIDEGINLNAAHETLSYILETENDWIGAMYHNEQALNHQNIRKNDGNYFHLGYLSLKAKQFDKAEKNFLKALSVSPEKEQTLKTIFSAYTTNNRPKELYQFYQNLRNEYPLSVETDILLARSLTDLTQYEQARNILNGINQEKPSAEVYYWLAKTAEREQDWDGMELASQKATVMEPENSLYHDLFSQALIRMNKLDRAEKESDLAIQHAEDKSLPDLHSHRASIKLQRQNYMGAIDDWKLAVDLKPDNPQYYSYIADTYERIGEKLTALQYYKKALDIDPNNVQYQTKYRELQSMN